MNSRTDGSALQEGRARAAKGRIARACVLLVSLSFSLIAPADALGADQPANDAWANAPVITVIPYSDAVDTSAATDLSDPYSYCGGGSNSVWYRIELSSNARVEISTAGSDFDTVVDLHDWYEPPGAFASRGCDDNSGPGTTSRLVADLAAGFVYAIMVSSSSGTPGGNLALSVSAVPPPANDDFDAATTIGALPFSDTVDAGSATTSADDPQSSCGGTGPSVWYDFTPAADGRFAIDTQGSSFDTLVTVYTGGRGALTEVACADTYWPIGSYQARLRFDGAAGTEYHVGVTVGPGFQPVAGILELAVAPAPAAPANDDFDSAGSIASLPFGQSLDISEATTASDDPAPSCSGPLESTVWYSITPTTTDRIRFQVRGDDFGPTVALYQGSPGAFSELGCSGGGGTTPTVELDPAPNLTYHLLVGGASGDAGLLRVDVTLAFGVTFTIDTATVDARSGVATVSGTITCNKPSFVSTNGGELRQKTGRYTVRGPIGISAACDGQARWTSTTTGDAGPFVAGKAEATLALFAYASETGEFSQPSVTTSVTLKATRN